MAIPSVAAMFWSSIGALVGGAGLVTMVPICLGSKFRELPWILAGCTLAVGALFFFSTYFLALGTRNRFIHPQIK